MFSGQTILDVATSRVGEKYVLGARVPLASKSHHGPWDCAEFVSWCVYQAYGIIMGARPRDPQHGDAYTGYWFEDAEERNATIEIAQAVATPGAILLRRPRAAHPDTHPIGHIAISRGDGSTIEARGAKYGVLVVAGALDRLWDTGVLVPGVEYSAGDSPSYAPPANHLRVESPFMRGPAVVAVQRALKSNGCSVGPVDGVFGPLTEAAIFNFQATAGIATDGVVGPETAEALGLGWPITPATDDVADYAGSARADALRMSEVTAARR